jgi:PAS domain-containing protein
MSAADFPVELMARSFSKGDVDAVRQVLDAVPHPIFVKDEQSRFLILNRSMCDFMGRSHEELVSSHCPSRSTPERLANPRTIRLCDVSPAEHDFEGEPCAALPAAGWQTRMLRPRVWL